MDGIKGSRGDAGKKGERGEPGLSVTNSNTLLVFYLYIHLFMFLAAFSLSLSLSLSLPTERFFFAYLLLPPEHYHTVYRACLTGFGISSDTRSSPCLDMNSESSVSSRRCCCCCSLTCTLNLTPFPPSLSHFYLSTLFSFLIIIIIHRISSSSCLSHFSTAPLFY